ncbi:hypothetical protein [Actinoplanes awajinensis]|uniref:Uncharacterized protein n=1 Tax=Actinoplanes awajinensis subsp. mycoplanecinus TaxID=135947 RepID=A0A0X3V9A6_9ACTN|nr:hypothetical protein [Actinoplanes awajinensis]KUL41361.1 hypothetical protein ADL15_03660 [Actinoplanes awajinensis subsp. mycoplanecinus]
MGRVTDAMRVLFGNVEQQRRIPFNRERSKPGYGELVGDGITNAEKSVLIQVSQTLAGYDHRRANRLRRFQHRLVTAAQNNLLAWDGLLGSQEDPRWTGHWGSESADRAVPPPETPVETKRVPPFLRATPTGFREDYDPHRPLISHRALTIAEAVFLVVEVAFWYGVFSKSQEPGFNAGQVSAALLAIFLPTAGILSARVVGALGHRWVSAYPGTGRRERIGTIFAGLVAAGAVSATIWLVYARFSAENDQVGAVPVPAGPMALIFGLMLLGDIGARLFLTSEIRTQTVERRSELRKVRKGAIKANAEHVRAWIDLRSEVQVQLDRCERVVAIGATMINDERAAAEHRPDRRVLDTDRLAHQRSGGLESYGPGDHMAVPSSQQLAMFGGALTLGPLRTVDDAIDTLDNWRPRGHPSVGADLHHIREQLLRLNLRLPRQAQFRSALDQGAETTHQQAPE